MAEHSEYKECEERRQVVQLLPDAAIFESRETQGIKDAWKFPPVTRS